MGLSVAQVVHNYGDVCQGITDLAVELDAAISTDDFRTLNRCLDDAIAGAVTEYGREHHQLGVDRASARESERVGFLVHELRNLTHTAILALDVLETGDVGVRGSTGAVLRRSLVGSSALLQRSLAEVRLTQGIQKLERVVVAEFIADIVASSTLDANALGVGFAAPPVEIDVSITADRQVLAAAVVNLLQNAFKFTRSRTTVTLKVRVDTDRVLIEIHDECGGLPDANVEELFQPFEQRSADRTGLGLGLAFSRWAVTANGGQLYARDLPGYGCVFTVDLPRLPSPATAAPAV